MMRQIWSIAFVVCSAFGFANAEMAIAADNSNLVVVSDVDDTLKISHIVNNGDYIDLIRRSYAAQEFSGMSTLLNQLKNKGADIHYVTATPQFLKNSIVRFIHENVFPIGRAWNRPSIFDDKVDFKFNTIKNLILCQPNKQFLLIGDDGEYDALIFEKLKSDPEIADKISGSFVHDLYHSVKNPNSTYYVSAVDLSLHLQSEGLISADEAATVLKYVQSDLEGGNYRAIIPEFAHITPEQIESYFNNPSFKPSMELSYIRDQIVLALAQGRPLSPSQQCLDLFGHIVP